MLVFAFSVWTNRGIANCSLRLEGSFCFGVKNVFWLCKWKRPWNKMRSENYIHAMTAPPVVLIRAGWFPPETCCSWVPEHQGLSTPVSSLRTLEFTTALQKKKNHSKKTRPPENHWYKSLNSASGTIIVIFFSEIKKRNFSSATNSCSENVPGGVQLVQFNYFHLQIDSLAMRKLLVVLMINSRFLLSLLCCGGAGEYIQRENEKFLMSCIR